MSLPLPLLSLPLPLLYSLCSRDLENLLSHLIPDEVLFHSQVLYPQHRHSYLDVVVYGLCGLVLVVVYGSRKCCQLGWNVVSESVHQHVHQESHIPRPKLGLPLHQELPPSLEPFVYAGIVTLVQRGSCSCHHQNVTHLCAECAFLAPEVCVESRCRRCFCLRQLLLIPLIHCSETRSQFERPVRVLHRISVELVWLSNHPCVDYSCLHALSWRARHALHLLCESFSFLCEYRLSCWMAVAIASCSSRIAMVVHARGANRGAFQVSALDPSCDPGNRPVTTFSAFLGALTAPPDSRETPKFTNPVFVTKQSRLRYHA